MLARTVSILNIPSRFDSRIYFKYFSL